MASIETSPLLSEKTIAVSGRSDSTQREGWKSSVVVSDIAILGAGTTFAALFNSILVFLIPRLMSVEQFGYWRLFLLYAGYVGFIHFGFADGALLRWVGKSREVIDAEVGQAWKYLVVQQMAVIFPAVVFFALAPLMPAHIRAICVAVLLFGLIVNSTTLLQYCLQAGRSFRPVAIATAVAPGVFVMLTFIWNLWRAPKANDLIVLYSIGWIVALLYLWALVKPRFTNTSESTWELGKSLTSLGWPVVLANASYMLVQSADRLVVSSSRSIYDFAQYSLAASSIFVPVATIAAVSRVFFAHAAGAEIDSRAMIYRRTSRILLIAWSLMLPYFFVLEAFVRRFLPKYVPALPVAGVLILSVIFLAEVQILQMSYFYLYGRQQEFLCLSIGALAVSLLVGLTMILWLKSLLAVAAGQVCALFLWWLTNEWRLSGITGRAGKDWLRILGVVAWTVTSYALVLWSSRNIGWRVVSYYAAAACVLALFCADDFRYVWQVFQMRSLKSR